MLLLSYHFTIVSGCWIIKHRHYTQVDLSLLQGALRVHGIEMDLDELECILANLIFQVLPFPSHRPRQERNTQSHRHTNTNTHTHTHTQTHTQGSIKGYIAHKKCVIFSKTDPFPPPSSANLR